MALNFYGYRENNGMAPFFFNSLIDERQDKEIATKADANEVNEWIDVLFNEMNSGLTIVVEKINENADNIAELSGKISDERAWVDENYVRKSRLSAITSTIYDTIDDLSGYTSEEIAKIWDAIDGNESGDTNIRKAVEEISGYVYDLGEIVSANTENIEELSGKVQNNTCAIIDLSCKKADVDWVEENFTTLEEFSAATQELSDAQLVTSAALNDLNDRLIDEIQRAKSSENTLSGIVNTEKTERKAADNVLSGAINTEKTERKAADNVLSGAINTEKAERKAADNYLSGVIDSFSAETIERFENDENAFNEFSASTNQKFTTQQMMIDALDAQMDSKADKADLIRVSGAVEQLSAVVDTKADKTALNDLADDLSELAEVVDTKASKDSLGELSGKVETLSGEVATKASQDDLDNTNEKLDELDNKVYEEYLTKEEAAATYPARSEVVANDTFNSAVNSLDSKIDSLSASTRNLVANEKNERVNNDSYLSGVIETLSAATLTRDTNIENDLAALRSTVNSNTSAITENRTDISCISELKGVNGTDISGYDNTGNGILDVLHREYHTVMEDTTYGDKSIAGLINYINDLEARIKALEDRI